MSRWLSLQDCGFARFRLAELGIEKFSGSGFEKHIAIENAPAWWRAPPHEVPISGVCCADIYILLFLRVLTSSMVSRNVDTRLQVCPEGRYMGAGWCD